METENKILPQGLQTPNTENQVRWLKSLFLAASSIFSFGVVWYLLNVGMAGDQNLVFWFWPSLAASFGVAFLSFLAIVDTHKKLFWGANFGILVLYLLFLPKTAAVAAGGVLFFLFVWLFERHIREDEHSRADFEINRILRSSINFMIYGLLIVLGFNLYNQIQDKFQQNPDLIYNQIGHYAAAGLQYVPAGVGNFNPNQSFDDFVTHQAESQQPQFSQAPPSMQQQIFDAFKQQLEARFNYKVSGNPLLGEVVAGVVASKVKAVSQNYSKFFPAIFALLIVIALRYVAFLFVWLASIVTWLMFKLFVAVKFFRIEKVQVEVDKLQI